MGIRTDKWWRQQFIFYTILIMIVALFTSRALLSIGMIAFLFFTCVHKEFGKQVKAFLQSPLCWGLFLLFLIPFLSFFWSEDKDSWLRWVRIKLPLFLLPIGFAGYWRLTARQWKWMAFIFLLSVFICCCWSMFQYAASYQSIHENYLRAHVLITPLDNDHVRFSLVVCIAGILSILLIEKERQKWLRWILIGAVILFTVFLHILSARTGLLGWYLFLFLYLLNRLWYQKNKTVPVITLIALLVLPLLAWWTLPTFQNRIRYFLYDISYVRNRTYLPGANDGNRVLSLQAGWGVLKEYPLGVGSGDVVEKTNDWYNTHMPEVQPADRIYPSSEWLLYGDTAGWPGVFFFTLAMVLPFFHKIQWGRIFWTGLILISALSFVFDIGLETQFGVFIYAFLLLWWGKWMEEVDS